jgi:hypothetical protein
MASIKDLSKLKPIRSEFNSDIEFKKLSILWEEHVAPAIVDLERMASTKPQPSSFEASEEFEEAFGFWMGRQGRVISIHLSLVIEKWRALNRSDG